MHVYLFICCRCVAKKRILFSLVFPKWFGTGNCFSLVFFLCVWPPKRQVPRAEWLWSGHLAWQFGLLLAQQIKRFSCSAATACGNWENHAGSQCSAWRNFMFFAPFSFPLLLLPFAFFNFLCVCISGSGHCEIFWVVYVIFKDLR